jgi:hypothetical protein
MSGLKLYVIGGEIELPPPNNVLNDVWVLDFSSPTPFWTNPVSSSPMASRAFHSAALDPLNNQLVVFGGVDGFNYRNDTWALNLTGAPSWKLLAFGGVPPSARGNASMVYSSSARAMLLFGGNGAGGSSLNDVWTLPMSGSSAWFPVLITGTPPGVRGGHGAIFDDATGKMLLFGGQDFFGGTLYPDAWELSF